METVVRLSNFYGFANLPQLLIPGLMQRQCFEQFRIQWNCPARACRGLRLSDGEELLEKVDLSPLHVADFGISQSGIQSDRHCRVEVRRF